MASLPLILVPAIDITVILPIYGHVAIKGDDVDQILSIYNPPFHSYSNLPDQTQWPLQIRQLKRSAKFWEGLSPSTTNKTGLSQWPPNWIFQGSNFYSSLVCLLNLNKIDIITTKLCFPIVLKIIIPGSQDCNLIKILLMTKLGHFQRLHKWHLTSKATGYLNQQFHKVSLVSVTKFLWYLKKSPLYSCHCNICCIPCM